MSIQQVFSVYDSKVEAFLRPWFVETKGAAIRAFADSIKDTNVPMAAHPEDYTLFHMGEFDNKTGLINSFKTPVSIGLALEFMNSDSTTKPLSPVTETK